MRFFVVGLAGLAALAACSSKKKQDDTTEPAPVGSLVRGDGGVTAIVTDIDPTGVHMDDDVAARPMPPQPSPSRPGKPIDVTLRSTPPGAQVAVDGTVLGNTPAFWSGMADGREHEFVFTMRGHAIARYRFVPVASGVIHGRLDPIHEETDAGVGTPPPEVMLPRPPTTPSVNPPTAPPTLVPDAAVAAPPGPVGPTPSAGSAESPLGPQP
ncbi:MAG TPA: PEGA domain-containing protein [Kofleriaceae bacterium]